MKYLILLLAIILSFTTTANADLVLIGQGTSTHGTYNLIYDTDLDVTWYDYSKPNDSWQSQADWADSLDVNYGGIHYADWRLPTTVDGIFVFGYDGTTTAGYNITSSEMGHLFYTELGNAGGYDTSGNPTGCGFFCLTNTSDFENLYGMTYWSSTEWSEGTSSAWYFEASTGRQFRSTEAATFSAIAVLDGRAIAPEPISSTLFIVGGVALGLRRFRKNFKK